MRKHSTLLVLLGLVAIVAALAAARYSRAGDQEPPKKTQLAIVWTSGDPDVAHRMVFMYLHASARNKWFAENRLIVWGPSAASGRRQGSPGEDQADDGRRRDRPGLHRLADSYGVTAQLRAMGIEVKGMGKPLSDLIQSGWNVLSF